MTNPIDLLSYPEMKSLESLHKLPLMTENRTSSVQIENQTQSLRLGLLEDIFHFLNNLSLSVAINIQRNCGEKMVNLQASDRREKTREY